MIVRCRGKLEAACQQAEEYLEDLQQVVQNEATPRAVQTVLTKLQEVLTAHDVLAQKEMANFFKQSIKTACWFAVTSDGRLDLVEPIETFLR